MNPLAPCPDRYARVLIAAIVLAACLAYAPRAQADPASDWVALADRALDGRPVAPPLQAQRERTTPALTALAIFEAVNAIDPRYLSYLDFPRAGRPASEEAAAVAAGYGVLSALYPERRAALDDARDLALSHIAAGPARGIISPSGVES